MCKCDEEIGDYSMCPRHGEGTAWLAEQERQERLRAAAAAKK
jgi:hypothetical protein